MSSNGYKSILETLFQNVKLEELANSVNGYVEEMDEDTIKKVAAARAFLWLERYCGKDGRVRAFGQMMPKFDSITNYNGLVTLPNGELHTDVSYMDINYHSTSGLRIKDGGYVSGQGCENYFALNFWHPFKCKFETNKVVGDWEIVKRGSNRVLLERTKYLNDMRLGVK